MKVSEKALDAYPWYVRLLFWLQRRNYGEVLKPGLLWGRSPRVFLALAFLYGAIDRRNSPLEPALRSLLTVRVSQINSCSFCVDINSATLAQRAGSLDKVHGVADWRGSRSFSDRERAALEYAEAVTVTGEKVSDELFARMRQHFDDDTIVELTALIAFQNLSSKFNSALDVPAQGFCSRTGV
jgi:uncharacterized peroxidase-related enzyme